MAIGKKYSLEEWKKICTEKHNGKYDYSAIIEYKNKNQIMKIYCKKHNCWFEQIANSHIRGMTGCMECKRDFTKNNLTIPLSEIKERVEKSINGKNIEVDYSTYCGVNKKITAYCHNKDLNGEEHGVFYPMVYNLINGHGCKKCGDEKTAERSRTNFNEFMEKIKILHPTLDFSLVKPFKNVEETIYVICHEKDEFGEEHGVFPTTPHRLLNGNRCKKCVRLEKIDVDTWKKRCNKIHNGKYIYDYVEFDKLTDEVKIVCKKHGVFWQTAHNHLYGHGCPICTNSKLENDVSISLNKNKLEYITNNRKILNGLELDFFIPSKNIAIECQGEQHFRPKSFGCKNDKIVEENFKLQQERDQRKKQLCEEQGIKLVYFLDKEYNKFMTENDAYFNNIDDLMEYINEVSF